MDKNHVRDHEFSRKSFVVQILVVMNIEAPLRRTKIYRTACVHYKRFYYSIYLLLQFFLFYRVKVFELMFSTFSDAKRLTHDSLCLPFRSAGDIIYILCGLKKGSEETPVVVSTLCVYTPPNKLPYTRHNTARKVLIFTKNKKLPSPPGCKKKKNEKYKPRIRLFKRTLIRGIAYSQFICQSCGIPFHANAYYIQIAYTPFFTTRRANPRCR